MKLFDEGLDGYQLQVWAVPSLAGLGYRTRLTVRQLPTLILVYEDETASDATGWASPQEALAAGLERGRKFVRIDMLCRARADWPESPFDG